MFLLLFLCLLFFFVSPTHTTKYNISIVYNMETYLGSQEWTLEINFRKVEYFFFFFFFFFLVNLDHYPSSVYLPNDTYI